MPASAVLLSPLADLSNTGASRLDNRWYDPMLPLDRKNDLANLYLRDVPIDDPIASPLFGDLSGLPPLLIQVGSTEILLDDALRVAARVRATGGACEAEVWHDMPHAWILIGLLPEASRACERIARFIDEAGQPSSVRLDWAA
jgi:acetyl esterase/lipase